MNRSYLTHKAEARYSDTTGGLGVYAIAPISQGETICVWGGHILRGSDFYSLPDLIRSHALQVDEDLFQTYIVGELPEDADYVNHSCNPNAGLQGAMCLVAMRDIAVGEEICFDYAMSDGSQYDEFDCACGASICRGRVTGNDWQLSELQLRYGQYMSPYLLNRIRHYHTRVAPHIGAYS